MAISNYTELQDALTNYTHRAGLDSRIPEFIQMGEADLNARLRTKDQETTSTQSMSTSVNTLALPSGFLEAQRLEYTEDLEEIVFVDHKVLIVSNTGSAQPFFYTIIDDNMVFETTPDSARETKLYYRKKYDIATDATNWLLTNYPNLYLMAAMVYAAFYADDSAKEDRLRARLYGMDGKSGEVAVVNRSEARKRNAGNAILVNDLPTTYPRTNILNG